jgi:hypothetical protein
MRIVQIIKICEADPGRTILFICQSILFVVIFKTTSLAIRPGPESPSSPPAYNFSRFDRLPSGRFAATEAISRHHSGIFF